MLMYEYKNPKKRKEKKNPSESYKSFNAVSFANVCGNSPLKLFEERRLQPKKTDPINPSATIMEKAAAGESTNKRVLHSLCTEQIPKLLRKNP